MRDRHGALWIAALALLAAGIAGAIASSVVADWTPPLLAVLLLITAVLGDRWEVESASGIRVVGSFPAFVLAAVLLGPAPAAAIGAGTMLIERGAKTPLRRLLNVTNYTVFPLLTGLAIQHEAALEPDTSVYALLVAAAFMAASLMNFTIAGLFQRALDGRGFISHFRATYVPLLSCFLVNAILTAALAYTYTRSGLFAMALAVVVLFVYLHLQRELLTAQATAQRLARVQFGVICAMVDTVNARDQMTARHSAAVARYAQRIARESGCNAHEQDLVHTAGLLHDVGKLNFTDAIFANRRLTEDEWRQVKLHPEQGAEIVGRLDGHQDVAAIIRAHHERIDGTGYPLGLAGAQIPQLSRMISIADTYDVMTARDSYRAPVTPEVAIAELRNVAGSQLDAALVETFVTGVLADETVAFRHGDDADFLAELDLEHRVREYANLAPRRSLLPTGTS
jgi:putative nucleotidyltransferase with HDIG domain